MAFVKPNTIPNTGIVAQAAYWRIETFSEPVKDTTNVVFYCYSSKTMYLTGVSGVINSHQVNIPSGDLAGEGTYRELIYAWCIENDEFFSTATSADTND